MACDSGCLAAVTNRLAVRDGVVISALHTPAHTIHLIGETAMIINAQYPYHVSYAAEREASRLFLGEHADDCLDDDFAGDAAEICRMIDLSGMIGLECGLLEGK
jgi:hypothetical protein